MTALVLPGLDVEMPWQVRTRSDRVANAHADRHYSRRTVGAGRVGGNGEALVLVTADESATWVSTWVSTWHKYALDGLDAWRCSIFRNEGDVLSSTLIRQAMTTTLEMWGDRVPHRDGWVTFVDVDEIASANPGYCFKRAGWWRDKTYTPDRRRRSLIRLRAEVD